LRPPRVRLGEAVHRCCAQLAHGACAKAAQISAAAMAAVVCMAMAPPHPMAGRTSWPQGTDKSDCSRPAMSPFVAATLWFKEGQPVGPQACEEWLRHGWLPIQCAVVGARA
jgi:hypothetical protein